MASRPEKKNLLILGGNGFIGAECVKLIINKQPDTNIYLINRGRSWDWDKEEDLKDKIVSVYHNRKKTFTQCPQTSQLLNIHWHAVVDFSGFKPSMVEDSIKTFATNSDLYIYISSDSVYEVCKPKDHTGPTRESDAVRPTDSAEQTRLAHMDEYGEEKLQCEEKIRKYLQDEMKDNSERCNFIILRLPDVVGPRDGTDRFWQYLLWVQMASETKTQVLLPKKYQNHKLSFVYVSDVSELVLRLVFEYVYSSVFNQEYNLGCSENPTLDEIIFEIRDSLMLKPHGGNLAKYDDLESVPEIYPSVERGPVDITKAQRRLSWSPTPWKQVVQETVSFYQSVNNKARFIEEKEAIYKDMKKDFSDFYTKAQLKCLKGILKLDLS